MFGFVSHISLLGFSDECVLASGTLSPIAAPDRLVYSLIILSNRVAVASPDVVPASRSTCIRLEKVSTSWASSEVMEVLADEELVTRFDHFSDFTVVSYELCYNTTLFLSLILRLRCE